MTAAFGDRCPCGRLSHMRDGLCVVCAAQQPNALGRLVSAALTGPRPVEPPCPPTVRAPGQVPPHHRVGPVNGADARHGKFGRRALAAIRYHHRGAA